MKRKAVFRILCLSVFALMITQSAFAAPKIFLKTYLMTGDEITGQLGKISKDAFSLRADRKKAKSIAPVNVIEISVCDEKGNEVTDEAKILEAGLGFVKRKSGYMGKLILDLIDSPSDETTKKIEAAYKQARLGVPTSLGGDTEYKRGANSPRTSRDTIERNRQQIEELGKKMKKIIPATHKIETDHFIIFSANSKKEDRKIVATHKKMYQLLSKRFGVQKGEHIWEGKLPVFACSSRDEFRKLGPVLTYGESTGNNAAGYQHRMGSMVYVAILAPRKSDHDRRFYAEILTHETSHAFLSRFQSTVRIRSWVNEGIAETNAGSLVKKSNPNWRIKDAAKEVKQGKNESLMDIITADRVPLGQITYGKAQLLVRFLMFKDGKKFVKFMSLLKQGMREEKALEEAYGYSYETLVKAVEKSVGKR